jgi:hypothetical protein
VKEGKKNICELCMGIAITFSNVQDLAFIRFSHSSLKLKPAKLLAAAVLPDR